MNLILKNKIEERVSQFSFDQGFCIETLPSEEKSELLHNSRILKFSKKSVVYSEGEPPKGMYIILKGKVKFSQLNFDGSVQILFIYGAPMIFGHRPILGNDKHPVTATALEDCELMFIEKEHFLNIVKGSQRFSNLLMQSISHEFTVLMNRINIFAQRGIKERLALFLLILNEVYKQPGQTEDHAQITLNRNDLAGYTGTSVENLVRTLKIFRENQYINASGKSIAINDFQALYSLAGI